MLALNMKLTPAQVRMLITMYGEHWHGDLLVPRWPKEGMAGFHFVTTMKSLISKGLVDHDLKRYPAHQLTDAGRGVAEVVLFQARSMLELVEGREERAAEMPERIEKAVNIDKAAGFKKTAAKRYSQTRDKTNV